MTAESGLVEEAFAAVNGLVEQTPVTAESGLEDGPRLGASGAKADAVAS